MTNTKQKIIKNIKRLVDILEDKWVDKITGNDSPLNSLAPKILADENERKGIQPYLDSLKQAIDAKDINNISLTGGYGSGKSTILKTFQYLYSDQYEYLNISLASFKDGKEKPDGTELDKKLEISILQQMFYHVKPSQIPDSRFKRIINLTTAKLQLFSISIVIWTLCALTLFKFDYVNMLNPKLWKLSSDLDWIALLSSIIFFTGTGFFFKSIYSFLINSKITKLTIKGELELGESTDKSVFNQHLEEILYFFERTRFNIIIIEDLDRFENTDIFTKLREINTLINNSELIERPVKFIYAIKDEMFKDKNERVKFFEFIIPVIPFINPSNAKEQLSKLISNANLDGELSTDFTSDVVTFIDDIDMRLLINIFHEYQLYRILLSNSLNQDSLFAIIVYKNLYPEDFGNLQKRRGTLFDFFANKPSYIKSILEQCNARIKELDEKIELIENEQDKPISELRAVYINLIVSKLENFYRFKILDKSLSTIDILQDTYFRQLINSKPISYSRYDVEYYRIIYNDIQSNIHFRNIENEVSAKLTYNEREKLLVDKATNQINVLKAEKEKIKNEMQECESMSIQELFETHRLTESLGAFDGNDLMRNLLLNGYINEHYDDYISLFHAVNLTKDDCDFIRKIKSGYNLPFDYQLIKIDSLLKEIPVKYFKKDNILNYSLLSHLLESKHTVQLDLFFKRLSLDTPKQFEFITGFIENKPEQKHLFIKDLCNYQPTIWQYISEKSGLPDEQIRTLLQYIFDYATYEAINKFHKLDTLKTVLSKIDDVYKFCISFGQTDTLLTFLSEKKVVFEKIELPQETQELLFTEIYSKNLYQLSPHNIQTIIKAKLKNIDDCRFTVAHYSTLLETNLTHLLDYIDSNMEVYIKQVLLSLEDNKEELESTIISILGREDVSIQLKAEFIESQRTKISSLTDIKNIEVKQLLIKNNSLEVNWGNIWDYYLIINASDAEPTSSFVLDELLINYFNQEKNYSVLSKDKLNISEIDASYHNKLSRNLIYCNSLSLRAYTCLLDSLLFIYRSVNFTKLDVEKIEALIAKNKLVLSKEDFENLKVKAGNLHIKLVESHQNSISTISEFELDIDDYIGILRSKVISTENKHLFIREIADDIIINNQGIANEVGLLLPEDELIPLEYDVVLSIFNTKIDNTRKIILLNLYMESLDNNQVQSLVEKLGVDYGRVFSRKKRPTFSNTNQHIKLFENLEKRRLIIRFEQKANSIQVIAKH